MGNFLSGSSDDDLLPDSYIDMSKSIFVEQKYEWDCGIACALMVMKWSIGTGPHAKFDKRTTNRLKEYEEYKESITNYIYDTWEKQYKDKPLWTIDIALYLLQLHSRSNNQTSGNGEAIAIPSFDFLKLKSKLIKIKLEMYTICKGFNEEHGDIQWYQKELNIDRARISNQFELASLLGLDVVERRYDLNHLARTFIASADAFNFISIILIDLNTLLDRTGNSLFGTNNYVGHFILLIGYEESSKSFIYLNPAKRLSDNYISKIGFDKIEAARAVSGTDSDIILCHRKSTIEGFN